MKDVAEEGIRIIHSRTLGGKDAGGAPFKPYQADYKARRSKSGRSVEPNLTWSGRMLGNMSSKFVSLGKALIFFSRSEEALKAAGNSNKRDFFDIRSNQELNELNLVADKLVGAAMKRAGLI